METEKVTDSCCAGPGMMWHYLRNRHSNKMKRVLIQAWDLAQGNETRLLNTAGDASPNQTRSACTSKWEEKMKLSPSLTLKHQEAINFAEIWERLLSPTVIESGRVTPAGWSQKRVTWRIRKHPPQRCYLWDASIAFAKHPKTEYFWSTPPTFLYI